MKKDHSVTEKTIQKPTSRELTREEDFPLFCLVGGIEERQRESIVIAPSYDP